MHNVITEYIIIINTNKLIITFHKLQLNTVQRCYILFSLQVSAFIFVAVYKYFVLKVEKYLNVERTLMQLSLLEQTEIHIMVKENI